MHRKIFIEQRKRSKKTTVYFWLLLIAATFFVTSMNLYRNSICNLRISENICSILAVTELYGEVDQYGKWKWRSLMYKNRTETKISREML